MPRFGPPPKGHRARAQPAPTPTATGTPGELPTLDALRVFLSKAKGKIGKSDISRAFGLTTEQRPALRALLSEIKATTPAAVAHAIIPHGHLPDTAVVEVTGTDPDGDPIAKPLAWSGEGRPPIIYMRAEAKGQPALAPGERVLARLKPIGAGKYEGRTIQRIATKSPARILGVYTDGKIEPTDRRHRADWVVPPGEANGAENGEIVLAEPLPGAHFGPRPARIVERLGVMGAPRSVSLICIHSHGIPDTFPAAALAEAEHATATPLAAREDLRATPLVTIDGDDARDFDDAIWAEPDGTGWRILVAIADVAHYVTPGSALDREAQLRGNSVYFPDRVVPMLPEALSNHWCSLVPNEDRGCLFAEMRFDASGRKTTHRFGRGLMRSAARLTYEQAQAHQEAGSDPEGVPTGHIATLYGAFRALLTAREARGTLELDLPERRVTLDAAGNVTAITPRARLDSHRLIEEFMIAANVAAAETLGAATCLYRIHDRPSDAKLEGLRQFLDSLGMALPAVDRMLPRDFQRLLDQVQDKPEQRLVHETILRAQSQAAYDPDNIGHFGLALPRYAHFTSPIRRYADLFVHRALLDALPAEESGRAKEIGEHITGTERRAAAAEREAVERYLAAHMATRVGCMFDARISGVTRFGLFVTLVENGASGIIPLASLPDDRWQHDEARQALTGRHTHLTFALGAAVEVRLVEASVRTGGMVFHVMQGVPSRRSPAR